MAIREALREVAAKVVGKDSEHVSRFHSRRGDLCNPGDLLAIPVLVWSRLAGKSKNSPWMAPAAVKHLDHLLSADDVVLELGSGASTAWYARRARRVVSLEPDPSWAERVKKELANHPNAEVRVGSVEDLFAPALFEVRPTVLIVDHSDEPRFSRTDAIRLALNDGAVPRLIVLDDSDRTLYRPAMDALGSWSMSRFTGFRDRPLRLTETTVFARWPAYTAAAMVLGAKQSPIDVIEIIPAALIPGNSFKDCANSSLGRREVTVTTDAVGRVVRRSVYVHSSTTAEPSNSTMLRLTYTSTPRASTRL